MIYNAKKLGTQSIQVNYTIPINDPYFLGVISAPFNSNSKNAIFISESCDGGKDLDVNPDRYYILRFTGVAKAYEDLVNGDIYFSEMGTYDVALYYQESATNTDPDNATLVEILQLQVYG